MPPSCYPPCDPGFTATALPDQQGAAYFATDLAPEEAIDSTPVSSASASARSSLLALGVSATLHIALWQLLAPLLTAYAPPIQPSATGPAPITINLQQPTPPAGKVHEIVVEAPPLAPNPAETPLPQPHPQEANKAGQARALPQDQNPSKAPTPRQSGPKAASAKHMIQRYFAAPPAPPEARISHSNTGHSGVFSSELQQKIDRARAAKQYEAAERGSVYITGSGQEVFINGDSCSRINSATDEYDVELWQVAKRCAWLKTDSEQFMERVNLELRSGNKEP